MLASVAASQNLNTIKDLHSRAASVRENMRDYNFRWNNISVKVHSHLVLRTLVLSPLTPR
jgi:hypothetical protein